MRVFGKIKNLLGRSESVKVSSPLKDIFVAILIGLIIAVITALGYLPKFERLTRFEHLTLDSMFRLKGERSAPRTIAIIEIEDSSLEVLGKWPWPRGYHATLLEILNVYRPRSVIFDILFPEADPGGDEAMAMVAEKSDNLYLAAYFTLQDAGQKSDLTSYNAFPLLPLDYTIKTEDRFLRAADLTLPVPSLLNAARSAVIVNAPPDVDGSTRHLPMVIEFRGKLYPTLSLQLACDYLGVDTQSIVVEPGFIMLPLKSGVTRIPIDSRGRMLLNFSGRIDGFERYSYIRILHDYNKALKEGRRSKLENLGDKIIFIGHTATGSVDLRIMPFSNFYPAVGIHATALGNVLENNMIRSAPPAVNIFIVLFVGILLSLLIKRGKKAYVNLAIMCGLFLAYLILSCLAFIFLNLWVYTFTPLAAILLTYVAVSINQYEAVRHEKKILENELLIARTIQQSFLPKSYPNVLFLEFAARCSPAKQIGGDLYDFVQLGNDKIGVLIGDVSGKGVPAALYMARAVSEFRSKSHLANEAASTLGLLNDTFAKEGMEKSFITMQYLIVDLKQRKFFFSNGGHNTILHFIRSKNEVEELDTKEGMPIGIMESTEFANKEIQFDRGDILFLYTDGISEAMNKKHKEFGIGRVKNILLNTHEMKAAEIMSKVFDEITKFAKGAPQHDDMTLIVIKAI